MMKKMALLLLVVFLAGCAARADEEFVKVHLGMSKNEVRDTVGEPAKVEKINFPGHTRPYEIWEYHMIPDAPICITQGAARFMTGFATLGLSEVAWSHGRSTPHWVYFLDNQAVFTSPVIICHHANQDCELRYHQEVPMPKDK
jgi:hypothetical protein